MAKDNVREESPAVFAADQGTSLASHGDGTPSIDEKLVKEREAAIKAEEAQEKKLRDDAAALKGSKSGKK